MSRKPKQKVVQSRLHLTKAHRDEVAKFFMTKYRVPEDAIEENMYVLVYKGESPLKGITSSELPQTIACVPALGCPSITLGPREGSLKLLAPQIQGNAPKTFTKNTLSTLHLEFTLNNPSWVLSRVTTQIREPLQEHFKRTKTFKMAILKSRNQLQGDLKDIQDRFLEQFSEFEFEFDRENLGNF